MLYMNGPLLYGAICPNQELLMYIFIDSDKVTEKLTESRSNFEQIKPLWEGAAEILICIPKKEGNFKQIFLLWKFRHKLLFLTQYH